MHSAAACWQGVAHRSPKVLRVQDTQAPDTEPGGMSVFAGPRREAGRASCAQPAALRINPPGHCKHRNQRTSFGRSIPLRRHEVAVLREIVTDASSTHES